MFDIFKNLVLSLVDTFSGLFMVCVKLLVTCILPFLTACSIYAIYYRIKGVKPIASELGKDREPFILYKLFIQLPRQIVLDRLTLDPNIFKEFGFYLVIGEQGSGKSMTMAYLLRKWQRIYKRLVVISNMGYRYETTKLVDLSQLSLETNGIYGEVDVIDEVQSVLGTEFSLKFPDYFKELIHQQRKVRRCILGGSQNFDQIAKPIRLQCRYVFLPTTLLGCFTIVRQYRCRLDKDGQLLIGDRNRPVKTFCFVHDSELRTCYDSYATIDKITVKL